MEIAIDTNYDEIFFIPGQYIHCASIQSHSFNNNITAPVAKNQNAVTFNTFKKVHSPRYLRLLLAY